MSPRARQAKGKARLTAYEKLLSQEYEQRREDLEIYIPPGPRLGDIVVELNGISKGYGERLLIDSHDAPVAEPVWMLYERLIARIGPRPTLIERDDNLPDFDDLRAERQRAHWLLQRQPSKPALSRAA
jgi:hypothetical protein